MRHKKEAQSATQHHTKAQKIDFLRQIKLLSPLNQKELSALCTQLKTVSFVRGATLIEQGTAGDSMFIVVSGRADIHVQYQDTNQCVSVFGCRLMDGGLSQLAGGLHLHTILNTLQTL